MSAWDRYVEQGTDQLTDAELEALVGAFQTATEAAADNFRKAEQ